MNFFNFLNHEHGIGGAIAAGISNWFSNTATQVTDAVTVSNPSFEQPISTINAYGQVEEMLSLPKETNGLYVLFGVAAIAAATAADFFKKPSQTVVEGNGITENPDADQAVANTADENQPKAEEAAEAQRKAEEAAEAQRKAEEAEEAQPKAEEAAEAQRKAKEAEKAQPKAEEAAETQRKAKEAEEAQPKAEEAEEAEEEAAEAQPKAEEAAETQRKAKEAEEAQPKAEEAEETTGSKLVNFGLTAFTNYRTKSGDTTTETPAVKTAVVVEPTVAKSTEKKLTKTASGWKWQ